MSAVELTAIEGRLPYASNATLLARSADGRRWVYKPEQGESPLWDFPWKSLAKREVLTFEVASAMHMEMVPETVEAVGPLGPGSAQAFIDEDADFDPRTLITPNIDARLWPVAVLDIVCNNADRKLGHLISEAGGGRIWAIDNGLTFHPEPKLRTILWGLAEEVVPAGLVDALRHLGAALEQGLWQRTVDLLGGTEADALSHRVKALLSRPVHPSPPTDRPALPWPLW